MAEDARLDGPEFDEVANYPLVCCERFLARTALLATASPGRRHSFLLPEIDSILDSYLDWLVVFGD